MKDTKFRILLDIHEVRSQATIPVKVGDVSCKIYITLVEGGKPYKIHENSFGVFTGKKGDDNPIFNNCIIENGIIRYDFTPQTVAAAGVLECEIRIYDEDGGVLTTPSFNIIVDERAVNDSEIESTSEFSFLDEIIVNEGQRIENEKNRNAAFNNFGIDLEDDGEVISIVKTDIDGSQEKASFLKYADVIPPVTATATGSAITIDSANAPLQALKLYGKTTQDGTPTPENPIELKSVGDSGSFEVGVYRKNLMSPLQEGTFSGITINKDVYGVYHLSGTATEEVAQILTLNLPKGVYSLSLNCSKHIGTGYSNSMYFIGRDSQNEWVLGAYGWSDTVYVSGELLEIKDALFVVSKGVNVDGVTIAPMLNIGSTALPYEPYKTPQIHIIPHTLRGVGEVKDEIDYARGVKTQKNYSVCINTMDNIQSELQGDYYRLAIFGVPKALNLGAGVCNRLQVSVAPLGANDVDNTICAYDTGIYLRCDSLKNASNQNEWLAEHPIHFIYPLETPIETPLTEQELNAYRQLMTNKGNTTILSEADMEVDYYINKPNAQAIGNIHSQINKDYFKLQQAIISTGGN